MRNSTLILLLISFSCTSPVATYENLTKTKTYLNSRDSDFGNISNYSAEDFKPNLADPTDVPKSIQDQLINSQTRTGSTAICFSTDYPTIKTFAVCVNDTTNELSKMHVGIFNSTTYNYFTMIDSTRFMQTAEIQRVDKIENKYVVSYYRGTESNPSWKQPEQVIFIDSANALIWKSYLWHNVPNKL